MKTALTIKVNKFYWRFVYILLSILICLFISKSIWTALQEARHADYASLSMMVSSFDIFFIGLVVALGTSLLHRDKFLKHRTIFLHIFSGTLNIVTGITFLLFNYFDTSKDNNLVAFFGIISLLIGAAIYINIFESVPGNK